MCLNKLKLMIFGLITTSFCYLSAVSAVTWYAKSAGSAIQSSIFKTILANSKANTTVAMDSQSPRFAVSRFFGTDPTRRQVITVLAKIEYFPGCPGSYLVKAMEAALDRLYQSPGWLPGYELAFELLDVEHSDYGTIDKFYRRIRNVDNIDDEANHALLPIIVGFGMVAPAQKSISEAVKHFDMVNIDFLQQTVPMFTNRRRYSSFFGMFTLNNRFYMGIAEMIRTLGWRRVAIFGEIHDAWTMMDDTFLHLLEITNITRIWFGRVTYRSGDANEMAENVAEMLQRDPRIIAYSGDNGVSFACWMYKYKAYGPNYVIFFAGWALDISGAIPPYVRSWCTTDMVAEVIKSSIFYGEVSDEGTDSTGFAYGDFISDVGSRVSGKERMADWTYSLPYFYDIALLTGNLVDSINRLALTKANRSLSDFTILFQDADFKKTPLILDALYALPKFSGQIGYYKYETATALNSAGHVPIGIFQADVLQNRVQRKTLIGIYRTNEKLYPLTLLWDRMRWRTKNGLPPKDGVIFVPVEVSLVVEAAAAVLMAIASVEIAVVSAILLFASVKSRLFAEKFNRIVFLPCDIVLLAGNLVLACNAYALPANSRGSAISNNCLAVAVLIIVGFTGSLSGIVGKLQDDGSAKIRRYVIPLWFGLINLAALIAFLAQTPVSLNVIKLDPVVDSTDMSLVLSPFYAGCKLEFSLEAILPLVFIAVLQLLAILYVSLLVYKVKTLRELTRSQLAEMKQCGTAVYLAFLVILGAFLISIALNQRHVILVSSAASLVIVSTNVLPIMAAKFLRHRMTLNIRVGMTSATGLAQRGTSGIRPTSMRMVTRGSRRSLHNHTSTRVSEINIDNNN